MELWGGNRLVHERLIVVFTWLVLSISPEKLTFPYCISSILIPIHAFLLLDCEPVKYKYLSVTP